MLQLDVLSLLPLELLYFKTGINPLLRLPRILKASLFSVIKLAWGISVHEKWCEMCPSFVQFMAFFEFNKRLEAILTNPYIYRLVYRHCNFVVYDILDIVAYFWFCLSESFEPPLTCCLPSTAMPVCITGALHMKVWVFQNGPMMGRAIGRWMSYGVDFQCQITIDVFLFFYFPNVQLSCNSDLFPIRTAIQTQNCKIIT